MSLHETPLRSHHENYVQASAAPGHAESSGAHRPGAATGQKLKFEVEYLPYGVADEHGLPTCELVASFGEVEPEYAAIRRGAGLFDSPHRGTLVMRGSANDRRDFLNRMVTQEMKELAPGVAKSAFWLNRKGRIVADLFIVELGDRALIDLDIHQASTTVTTLSEFLFSEDIEVKDESSQFHHIAIHGKLAAETIAAACGLAQFQLEPNHSTTATIDNTEVIIARRDQTSEIGYELIMPYDKAPAVWEFLLAADHIVSSDKRRVRPIGWHAFNIARLEAGTPLFNIDFGTTNLPHETGILRERVSFTKGCYLGQEVVARMENLGGGKPKQMLMGLRVQGDLLPVAGGQVFVRNEDGAMGEEIGVVTSSTLSPMLGAAPIAFAMMKTAKAQMNQSVLVNAEGEQAHATIAPLQSWPPVKQEVRIA